MAATTVAILGIAGALAPSYPAGAKPATAQHAHCANTSKHKTKRATRRLECKKARNTHGTTVRSSQPTTTAPATTTPASPGAPGGAQLENGIPAAGPEVPATTDSEVMGTLTIKLYSPGINTPTEAERHPAARIRVTRLRPGENAGFTTWEEIAHGLQTLQVPPGEYEVRVDETLLVTAFVHSSDVTVSAGESQQVSFTIGPPQ